MMGIGLPRLPHPVYPVHPCKYLPWTNGVRWPSSTPNGARSRTSLPVRIACQVETAPAAQSTELAPWYNNTSCNDRRAGSSGRTSTWTRYSCR